MKFFKLALISAALALFIIACTQNKTANVNVADNTAAVVNSNAGTMLPQPTATTAVMDDELASARIIYSEICTNCHKENGTGGVSDIDGKKIKAPNFTSDRMKKDPDSDFIETIENGAKEDGMPAYKGKLTDAEIKDLVKYIRREFQGRK